MAAATSERKKDGKGGKGRKLEKGKRKAATYRL